MLLPGESIFPPLMAEIKYKEQNKCRRYTDDKIPPQVRRLFIAQLLNVHSKYTLLLA